jgi:hypothetical protein
MDSASLVIILFSMTRPDFEPTRSTDNNVPSEPPPLPPIVRNLQMPHHDDSSELTGTKPTLVAVPAGAPAWVTPELIEHTLRVWQPFYQDQLIPEDALAIIMSVGRLVDVLSGVTHHETVRRTRPSQQP